MSNLKRLDQLLSNCGYCSRNEAKKLIKNKRITVNGEVIKDPSAKADPKMVLFDDEPLDHPEGILVMLNKPVGYVCSHDSREGARIYDLFSDLWPLRNPAVSSIGRLDKDTTGLILVTDYTHLIHDFTSPKHHVEKTYRVTVNKPLQQDVVTLFARGALVLKDETDACLPARLEIQSEHTADLTLTEGRYHQVKRMFAAAGYEVTALHRWRFGPYVLDDLKEGEWKDVPVIAP
jgi:16S rRNA pseudouridine516 synthase